MPDGMHRFVPLYTELVNLPFKV